MRFRRQAHRWWWRCLSALIVLCSGISFAETPNSSSPGDEPGQRPQRPSLFISPAGQPFRAGAGEPYPVGRWFAQADRNGDGRIDRSEFRADAESFFRVLDANHDGVVDGFEIADYEHKVVPEILGAYGAPAGPDGAESHRPRPISETGGRKRGRRGVRDSDPGDVVMGGAAAYELLNLPEPVASADTNLSGKVTLADFMAATDKRFAQLDSKGLGFLTLADLPLTPIQRAAETRAKGKRGS
jgi:hypothetical protein